MYDSWNRWGFVCRRKDNSDEAALICAGRLFQTLSTVGVAPSRVSVGSKSFVSGITMSFVYPLLIFISSRWQTTARNWPLICRESQPVSCCQPTFLSSKLCWSSITRVGKEPEPRFCQQPNRTIPHKEPNRPRTQMSWFLLGSFAEWSCSYIHTFHNKRGILLYLG